jgi:adenylosuccinate synthase
VAAGYAAMITRPTCLAVMHLDTLSGLDELNVCVAYRNGPTVSNHFPADAYELQTAQPIYETLPGWDAELSSCRRLDDLPAAARDYLDLISTRLATPIGVVGVGPGREQVILVDNGA